MVRHLSSSLHLGCLAVTVELVLSLRFPPPAFGVDDPDTRCERCRLIAPSALSRKDVPLVVLDIGSHHSINLDGSAGIRTADDVGRALVMR